MTNCNDCDCGLRTMKICSRINNNHRVFKSLQLFTTAGSLIGIFYCNYFILKNNLSINCNLNKT